jgi:hypothetical protein
VADLDVLAREVSDIGERLRVFERRLVEVERVNAQLEEAALNTSRALQEVSRHWDAVYEAMRRPERVEPEEELV